MGKNKTIALFIHHKKTIRTTYEVNAATLIYFDRWKEVKAHSGQANGVPERLFLITSEATVIITVRRPNDPLEALRETSELISITQGGGVLLQTRENGDIDIGRSRGQTVADKVLTHEIQNYHGVYDN